MSPEAKTDATTDKPATKADKPAAKAAPAKAKKAKQTEGSTDAQRAKMAQMAASAILKSTGLKVVEESHAPLPAVSSGSSCIDDLIGGTPALDGSGPKCLGYPRRHITEIFGAESSGKTTAALEAIAEAQQRGGWAMFIDFEHALDHDYAKKVGVSFAKDKLMLYAPSTIEQGWRLIYVGIAAGVDLIVIDSVAAMVPNAELNKKKPGDTAKIGAVAAAMAQNLPKVCIWLNGPASKNPLGTAIIMLNQIRATINTGGGGGGKGTNENTSGGYALKFFAYLRLKFTRIGSEVVKKKDKFTGKEKTYAYGNHTMVKLVKSKIDGKQGFTSNIFIRYNQGIDDYYSMIEAGLTQKIVKRSGAYYEFGEHRFQGRDKFRAFLMENTKVFEDLRKQVLAMVRTERDVQDDEVDEENELLSNMNEALEEESLEPEEAGTTEVEAEDGVFDELDASESASEEEGNDA